MRVNCRPEFDRTVVLVSPALAFCVNTIMLLGLLLSSALYRCDRYVPRGVSSGWDGWRCRRPPDTC